MKACYSTALLLLASFQPPSPAQQPFILTDGTPLRVRLNRNLSSADAKVGETVDFDVVEDVLINGAIVIQRGSRALATVTEAKPKGRMGKSGKLNLNIDHARSVLGEKIALRAIKEDQGGNRNTSLGSVATSIVTAPLLPFMKGDDVTIPKGTEVTAYVHGDARLDEARIRAHPVNAPGASSTPAQPAAAPAAASPPAAQPSAPPSQAAPSQPAGISTTAPPGGITNVDVLALKEAGFSDDLIIAKIKASRCSFRLETADMIELKRAGLSDRVIAVMMEKSQ